MHAENGLSGGGARLERLASASLRSEAMLALERRDWSEAVPALRELLRRFPADAGLWV